MPCYRVTERTDAIGRKVLHYTDLENPQLVFMPLVRGQRKSKSKSKKKKRGQTKIFLFENAPQLRRDDL